jgi:glyoxylase-like metal-dependent hydrolase (beta-lactamase superfamily II)
MTLSISTFILGPIENNTYLIVDAESKIAAVIDPSVASRDLFQKIMENNWHLEYILITHAHFDHIGGVKWLKGQFNNEIKVALHPADLELWQEGGSSKDFGFDFSVGIEPNLMIENNQILRMGDTSIKVLHTPGHTPGHVTFSIEDTLAAFCGDLIFFHGVGRTDLKTSNENDLIKSIEEKIFMLDPKTTLYPGHGPTTTVNEEKENNPFF